MEQGRPPPISTPWCSWPRFSCLVSSFPSFLTACIHLSCLGRYLEVYSKARTADALTALSSLRPAEALLISSGSSPGVQSWSSGDRDVEKGDGDGGSDNGNLVARPGHRIDRVSVDLLEIGDIVRVLNGSSPPCDGTIVSNVDTLFDESSLTGEAKLVKKETDDQVFLGTINKLKVVDVRVDTVDGTTM